MLGIDKQDTGALWWSIIEPPHMYMMCWNSSTCGPGPTMHAMTALPVVHMCWTSMFGENTSGLQCESVTSNHWEIKCSRLLFLSTQQHSKMPWGTKSA